jgi:hypothetical protein
MLALQSITRIVGDYPLCIKQTGRRECASPVDMLHGTDELGD